MAPSCGNPGNVETRNILVGGVTVSMCTVMEVKDTSLSEISGESGIFCTVVALASAEFALIPAEFFAQPESICCSFVQVP
jgi:hypothetical protein